MIYVGCNQKKAFLTWFSSTSLAKASSISFVVRFSLLAVVSCSMASSSRLAFFFRQ